MPAERRWSLIPRSRAQCVIWAVIGALLLGRTIWVMVTDSGSGGILNVVSAVLAVVVVVTSLLGLIVPRLRER